MNRASPVDLRKCLEAAHGLAHIGIRFVPIPVATDEEFQALSAELSRKLEQMAVEAEKAKAVQHERRNHRSGQRAGRAPAGNDHPEHAHQPCGSFSYSLPRLREEIPERRRELVADASAVLTVRKKRNYAVSIGGRDVQVNSERPGLC